MTKLKFINVFICQWFFVRITRHIETEPEIEARLCDVEDIRLGWNVKLYQWYSLQLWILPLTGWWNDFVYLNKRPKFIKLTSKKEL